MRRVDIQTRSLFTEPDVQVSDPRRTPMQLREDAMKGGASARSEYARSVSIGVPGYRLALEFMEGLLEKAKRTQQPGGLWILGDGGQGKSFVLQSFLRRHPPVQSVERLTYPVLYLRFAGRPAESDILLTILLMLGQNPETLTYQKNHELRDLVVAAMNQCGVRVILFDESQHVWLHVNRNRQKDRLGGPLGDFLKSLYDESGVGYVFAGTPGLKEFKDIDSQAATRWPGILELSQFDNDKHFTGLLVALDEALPMEQPAELARPDLQQKIYETCGGNFRLLKNFIAEAVHEASASGSESILMHHLAKAHFQTFCSGKNPFADALL